MPSAINMSERKGERGVTILLVAVALVVMLGLAALGIDVVTLYVARTETQRAADAAALAGARAFVASGFTSGQLGAVSSSAAQDQACVNGGSAGTGAANQEAQAVAAQNQIAGQAASVQSILCNFSQPENPRITVSVQRTDLPTFFSRIWGNRGNSVSTTATAEAFNPSGSNVPIQVISVKPWLIPNCDPNTNSTACPGSPYYISSSYALNSSSLIGQHVDFRPRTTVTAVYGQYYLLDMSVLPGPATVCPAPNTAPASSCSLVGSGGYLDDIACANRNELTCGSMVQPHNGPASLVSDTIAGTQCLIHTNFIHAAVPPPPSVPPSPRPCPDPTDSNPDCFVDPGAPSLVPIQINGGQANPNTALQNVSNISRSDSIVSVPIFDGATDLCTPSCSSGPNAQVIGFLQLGIQYVASDGDIGAIILNIVGCNPAATGTAVSGSGVTPIPVRLIHN
jgi:putative Flp pilus-assembly TadE/G-like protein